MSASIFCGPIAAWWQLATHKPLRNKKTCTGGLNFENQELGKYVILWNFATFITLLSDEWDYHHWKGNDFQFTNHFFFCFYFCKIWLDKNKIKFHQSIAPWVEFVHIDACDLVSASPLSHLRTSPQVERRAAEHTGAERSGAEWSSTQWSVVVRSTAERNGAEWNGVQWNGVLRSKFGK